MGKLVLRDPMNGVPGGWEYTVPETGHTIYASNYNSLFDRVSQHLVRNNFSIEGIGVKIQEALCAKIDPQYCRDPDKELPPFSVQVVNAASTAVRAGANLLMGNPLAASDEVAKKRIAICDACPNYRRSDDRCTLCGCFINGKKAALHLSTCPDGRWPV